MRLIGFLILLPLFGCSHGFDEKVQESGDYEDTDTDTDTDIDTGDELDPRDAIFEELKSLMDWGFDASGSYQDDDMIDIANHKSPVESFKGFGNSPPSLPNLYLVSPDFPVDDLWFGDEGVKSLYWDFGGYDRFINIPNTLGVSYETNPGQVSGLSGDTDHVYFFRLWHGTFWEEIGLKIKWMGDKTLVFYGGSGETFISAPIEPIFGTDYILRMTYKTEDLSIRVTLNGEEIITGTLTAPRDIKEFVIGTNSHPLAQHFRFYGMKLGEFTDEEMMIIEDHSNQLWPRDQKPEFPYLDGLANTVYTDFDRTENVWSLPTADRVTFIGGSGVEGVHRYQWYYWNADLEASIDGSNTGILDIHRPLEGATGTHVDRDDYAGPGQPFYGHEGDAFNRVFCAITPVDSDGVEGVRFRTNIWYDNIE
jgi:hypothetical protein